MARETRILRISRPDVERLERLCTSPDPSLERDSIVFDRSVPFGDDRTAYIQVISSKEPTEQPCWTQAVLFQRGVTDEYLELACTPPGTAVLGEYCMHLVHTDYVIDVVLDRNEDD